MPQQDMINQVVDRVNDFNRRVRDLEEKIRNLTARVNTLDDTIMSKTEDLQSDIDQVENDITQVRDRIANLEIDVKELKKQDQKYVSQKEIAEIESYIDLMDPLNSHFTTKTEVKDIIDERIEKKIDK